MRGYLCITCLKNKNGVCQKNGINSLGMQLVSKCNNYKKDKKFIAQNPVCMIDSKIKEDKHQLSIPFENYSNIIVNKEDIKMIIEWFKNIKYEPLKFLLDEGILKYNFEDKEYTACFINDSGDCIIDLYGENCTYLLRSIIIFRNEGYEILPLRYKNRIFPELKWKNDISKIENYSKIILAQLYYMNKLSFNKKSNY